VFKNKIQLLALAIFMILSVTTAAAIEYTDVDIVDESYFLTKDEGYKFCIDEGTDRSYKVNYKYRQTTMFFGL